MKNQHPWNISITQKGLYSVWGGGGLYVFKMFFNLKRGYFKNCSLKSFWGIKNISAMELLKKENPLEPFCK